MKTVTFFSFSSSLFVYQIVYFSSRANWRFADQQYYSDGLAVWDKRTYLENWWENVGSISKVFWFFERKRNDIC